MTKLCGKTVTITCVNTKDCYYVISGDNGYNSWTDEMIEGLMEKDVNIDVAVKETIKDISDKVVDTIMGGLMVGKSFNLPQGYQFKDENGNVINARKIVLEKKKKEYPKTYEECAKIFNEFTGSDCNLKGCIGYMSAQLTALQKLLICRAVYWKIAGVEMGLGKLWKNSRCEVVYGICRDEGNIVKRDDYWGDTHIFEFPIREMRDAFYENFKSEIEECKELL